MFDVTAESSFQNIRKWVQDVHTYAEQSVNLVLIGNKIDKAKRAVETEKGKALAEEYDIKYFETSAKTGDCVEEAFTTLVEDVCDRMFSGAAAAAPAQKGAATVDVSKGDGKKKGGCC